MSLKRAFRAELRQLESRRRCGRGAVSDGVPSVRAVIIDCGSCAMASIACDDCVVTALLGPVDVGGLTIVPDAHARALNALAEAGMVPPLRLVPLTVIRHEPPHTAAG